MNKVEAYYILGQLYADLVHDDDFQEEAEALKWVLCELENKSH